VGQEGIRFWASHGHPRNDPRIHGFGIRNKGKAWEWKRKGKEAPLLMKTLKFFLQARLKEKNILCTYEPYLIMVKIIKAEVSEALARKCRKKAMEIYGYRNGAIKASFEDLLKCFVASGDVDWKLLRGCIKSELTSVELQHRIWRGID
jgi:hypothetical protein